MSKSPHSMPLRERATCTVEVAQQITGLGRSTIYVLLDEGQLDSVKVRGRRLIKVPSLLKLCGDAPQIAA